MRILILCPLLGNAFGQERVLLQSTRLLRASGHEVFHVGKTKVDESLESDGITLLPEIFSHDMKSSIGDLRKSFRAIEAVINKVKPDVLHLYQRLDSRIEFFLFAKVPTVFTEHFLTSTCPQGERMADGPCERKSGPVCLWHDKSIQCLSSQSPAKKMIRVADFILHQQSGQRLAAVGAISQYVQRMLILAGFDEGKVHYVPNPVSLTKFSTPSMHVPANLILCASRLIRYKGVETLVEAARFLESKDWTIWICGEGAEHAALEAKIKSFGLEKRIILRGRVSFAETQQLVAGAAVLVQPNIGPEPFGLSVAEACLMETPVVVANLPALNETVVDEKTGFTFEPGDALDLARKIDHVLKNRDAIQSLLQASHSRIEETYSNENHLKATLNLYRSALENRSV